MDGHIDMFQPYMTLVRMMPILGWKREMFTIRQDFSRRLEGIGWLR
jgi:hypothetical protein